MRAITCSEAYVELCQTSKMERFAKNNSFYLLAIFVNRSILHACQGFEYASAVQS